MHSRVLIYVLIAAVWIVFTGAVMIYQARDSATGSEQPEGDAGTPSGPGEPEFSAAA